MGVISRSRVLEKGRMFRKVKWPKTQILSFSLLRFPPYFFTMATTSMLSRSQVYLHESTSLEGHPRWLNQQISIKADWGVAILSILDHDTCIWRATQGDSISKSVSKQIEALRYCPSWIMTRAGHFWPKKTKLGCSIKREWGFAATARTLLKLWRRWKMNKLNGRVYAQK